MTLRAPFLGLLLVVAPTLHADPAAQFAELDFLEGHWRGETWQGYTTGPEGGVILSLAKEFDAAGAAAFFEFERIAIEGDRIVLTPSPFGKPSVSFPMVELDVMAKRVRFENPAHDFPRSIEYHRATPEELVFTLHGERGGEPVESRTRLRRVEAP